MKLVSPLRYPGGKAKIVDFVKQVIRDNNLLDGVYVEPYAGGAAVALSNMSVVSSLMIKTVPYMLFGIVCCMRQIVFVR